MSKRRPTPPIRPTARVLLLDRDDRILLIRGGLPGRPETVASWFTVGGALEPGETYLEAAAREILEETGIADFQLGPVVWLREGVLGIPHPTYFVEQYVVARCEAGPLSRDGWDAMERSTIEDVRWWTHAELAVTEETVFPPGLSQHLGPILAGAFPRKPQRIPW